MPKPITLDLVSDSSSPDRELLQALLDSAFQGLMALRPVLGGDGKTVDLVWTVVNAGAEQLLGKPSDTLIGTSFLPAITAWPIPGAADRLLRVLDSGIPDAFDLALRIDGQPSVMSIKVTAFAGGLAIYARDVTDRRADEIRMRELEQRARRAERRLIDALDASPDPFAVFDSSSRLVVKIKRVSPSGSADFRHAFADARVSSV